MTASGLVSAGTAFGQRVTQDSVSPGTTSWSHRRPVVGVSAPFAATAPERQHRTVVEGMATIRRERSSEALRLALVRAGRVERAAVSLGSHRAPG